MDRSDTEPRRIGIGFASFLASLRTASGTCSWGISTSYGYYSRRHQIRNIPTGSTPAVITGADGQPLIVLGREDSAEIQFYEIPLRVGDETP